jgi:hypothetical protein
VQINPRTTAKDLVNMLEETGTNISTFLEEGELCGYIEATSQDISQEVKA